MRLQHLKDYVAAIEAFSACADVDALMAALLAHTRHLFRVEVAFVWLVGDGEQLHLHQAEGIPAVVASRLRQMKISASAERSVARRLHRLAYRGVLAAPLRAPTRMLGMVAVGSQRSRRYGRIDATIFKTLVQYAGGCLERLQSSPSPEGGEMRRHETVDSDLAVQNERIRLMDIFISGIAHDLNNAMATLSGRVELLLNRLHAQVTLQHLGAAHRAIIEASHMIRHIHGLVSGHREQDAVMVDINQLVRDSLQMAQSTWFQEFRPTRVPVDLGVDLNPVPALLARSPDLRIAILSLLRHAMAALRPGSGLMVRTWSEGEDEGQTVFISIADDPGQTSTLEREEGIGVLLRQVQTSESQRALEFVQAIIRNLDGRITVQRSADGDTTTTLSFPVRRTAAWER
jgi:signal transduction histidine kinase